METTNFIKNNNLNFEVENKVFVFNKITDCMQMRIMYDKYTEFECGIDIITLADGSHLITSTIGISAKTFKEFAKKYVEDIVIKDALVNPYIRIKPFKRIIFCDDELIDENFDIIPNTIIEDDTLSIGCIIME